MQPALFSSRLGRRCCGLLFFAIVLVAALGGGYLLLVITCGIDDGYALWGAAVMIIDYMEAHDGAWPSGWEDLQSQFAKTNGNVTGWREVAWQNWTTTLLIFARRMARPAKRYRPIRDSFGVRPVLGIRKS